MRNPNSPLTSLVSDEDPGRQWCLGRMVSEHYHHHGFSGNYSYTWEVGRLPGGRWGETFPTEILLHQCLVSHQLPVSHSGSPAVSSTVIVQDFALSGSGGWMGRRAQQELVTVDLMWDSFCQPIGKKSNPVFPLIIFLCYFHIYFQQIETELRQMEIIKDQYQKKNYEQVYDFHTLCLPFT